VGQGSTEPPYSTDVALSMTSAPTGISQLEETMYDADSAQLCCVGLELHSVPIDLGIMYGKKTLRLDLSDNDLQIISNLEDFSCLEELLLDSNDIGDDFVLPYFHSLRTLSLNKNHILDLERLLAMLEKSCPSLTYLSLIGNGACPNGMIWGSSDDDYAKYRRTVVSTLNGLIFLDSTAITAYERASAVNNAVTPGLMAILKAAFFGSGEALPEAVDHSTQSLKFYEPSEAKTSFLGLQLQKNGVLGISLLADKWIVT